MDANTVKDAQNFLRIFRAATSFAESIVAVSQLESEVKELEQRRASAIAEGEKQHAVLKDIRRDQDKAKAAVADAEKKAKQLVLDASHSASEITAVANKEAHDMISAAKLVVSELQAAAKAEEKAIADLKKQRQTAAEEKLRIETAIADLKAKL